MQEQVNIETVTRPAHYADKYSPSLPCSVFPSAKTGRPNFVSESGSFWDVGKIKIWIALCYYCIISSIPLIHNKRKALIRLTFSVALLAGGGVHVHAAAEDFICRKGQWQNAVIL